MYPRDINLVVLLDKLVFGFRAGPVPMSFPPSALVISYFVNTKHILN